MLSRVVNFDFMFLGKISALCKFTHVSHVLKLGLWFATRAIFNLFQFSQFFLAGEQSLAVNGKWLFLSFLKTSIIVF